jgi:valyl-tRNA synthetase
MVQALDLSLAELRYDESANTIYHFVWATFCDWYVELIKGQIDEETKAVAGWVLDQILVMLHPFMPFITEELWNANERPYPLIVAKWPMPDAQALDPEAAEEIEWLIRMITEIRSARTEVGIPPSAIVNAWMYGAGRDTSRRMLNYHSILRRMARIGSVSNVSAPNAKGLQVVVDEATLFLEIEGVIDIAVERSRLAKMAEAAEKERDALAARLANPSFVERAKPEAVEKARADHAEKASDAEKYRAALARLA